MPFQQILQTIVESHAPDVRAAIFCDEQGEKVGASAVAGMTSFDVDLLGAAYAAVAARVPDGASMRVTHLTQTVWLAAVHGGYYLVVLCEPARDAVVRHDLPRVVAALASHM